MPQRCLELIFLLDRDGYEILAVMQKKMPCTQLSLILSGWNWHSFLINHSDLQKNYLLSDKFERSVQWHKWTHIYHPGTSATYTDIFHRKQDGMGTYKNLTLTNTSEVLFQILVINNIFFYYWIFLQAPNSWKFKWIPHSINVFQCIDTDKK